MARNWSYRFVQRPRGAAGGANLRRCRWAVRRGRPRARGARILARGGRTDSWCRLECRTPRAGDPQTYQGIDRAYRNESLSRAARRHLQSAAGALLPRPSRDARQSTDRHCRLTGRYAWRTSSGPDARRGTRGVRTGHHEWTRARYRRGCPPRCTGRRWFQRGGRCHRTGPNLSEIECRTRSRTHGGGCPGYRARTGDAAPARKLSASEPSDQRPLAGCACRRGVATQRLADHRPFRRGRGTRSLCGSRLCGKRPLARLPCAHSRWSKAGGVGCRRSRRNRGIRGMVGAGCHIPRCDAGTVRGHS